MPNPSYRRTLQLIGQICTTWNEIELLWYLIYTCLVHELPRDKAKAIYWMFQTFANQRALVMSLADSCFRPKHNKPHPLRRQLGQLHAVTEELAGKRNAIVHGNYALEFPDGEPPIQGMRLRITPGSGKIPNRFASKDLQAEALQLVNANCILERDLENYRRRLLAEFLPADKRPPKEFYEPLPRLAVPPTYQE